MRKNNAPDCRDTSNDQYRVCIEALQNVLDEWKTVEGEDDPRYADLLCALAALQTSAGEHSKAEPLLEKALDIRSRHFGRESLAAMHGLQQLGQTQEQNNSLQRAEKSYAAALDAAIRNFGLRAPESRQILEDLTRVIIAQNRDASEADRCAAGLSNAAMNDRMEAFPWEHYRELGEAALQVRNYKDAERIFGTLRDVAIAFCPNSMFLAQSLELLADSLFVQRRYDEAFRLRSKALIAYERLLGHEDPSVARHLARTVEMHFQTEVTQETLQDAERALQIFESRFGMNHEETARMSATIASLRQKLSPSTARHTPEFAQRRLQRMYAARSAVLALETAQQTGVLSQELASVQIIGDSEQLGADDLQWNTHMSAGQAAWDSGNKAEAESEFAKAIDAADAFGEKDRRRLDAMCKLAEVYSSTGKLFKAVRSYATIIDTAEKMYGPENPVIVPYLALAAKNFEEQNDVIKMQECYERIVRIFTAASAPPQVIEPYQRRLDELSES